MKGVINMSKNEKNNLSDKIQINWYPGHMAKTKRLIKEMINLIDVVYEVIDSRIPYSSKIKDIDELIKNKPRILIMAKKDLCDLNETKLWQEYYLKKGYQVLIMDLKNDNDYQRLIKLTNDLGANLQSQRKAKNMQEKVLRALVIGIPNVGKSTLINKLAGKKVVAVGNMPGVTKGLSWLNTKANIMLLDSPGILWPKFDNEEIALNLAAMTAIKSEILPITDVAYHALQKMLKYYPQIIANRYQIPVGINIDDAYYAIAKKIGAIAKDQEIDYEKISHKILNDIKNEYLKNITFDRIDELC